MAANQVREDFLSFFESKAHARVSSAPVAPQDDPTLLFTNAGMNQFKDIFLGSGRRDYSRAVDTQKCIRVSGKHNDLEEVGISLQHHTFFEMLGNWSFGDYFKQEAITWAWELLTEVWKLPQERMWATVFGGDEQDGLEADEEAEILWPQVTDIRAERVLRLGKKDNFWEMGETGPCGPCSEIHYYVGEDPDALSPDTIDLDSEDFTEIWNLVFIQFNRDSEGVLHTLPAKHVDTGMGFERVCAILQGVRSSYDTDLFQPLIAAIGDITGKSYIGQNKIAMQVVSDHIRALTFAIAEGVLPSNEGRGYVLRRILRRAARFGRNLGMHEPFIYKLTSTVEELLGPVFPEISEQSEQVARVIKAEEEGFGKTLDRGLEIFENVSQKGRISGEDAFRLYDTYGFPIDLTQLMAGEKGLDFDLQGFEREMATQQSRSREAGRKSFASEDALDDGFLPDKHSEFVGYETLSTQTSIVAWRKGPEGSVEVYLESTPFYAESGGQVGDCGRITSTHLEIAVENTFRVGEGIVHRGTLKRGSEDLLGQAEIQAEVDEIRRMDTARNHTATHLLHEGLREVLGDHVNQAGSLVTSDRLRFDFTHFQPVDQEQQREIERIVNDAVRRNLSVAISYTQLENAREKGARMLFTEKYGDVVRTVRIGEFSFELCGGTHVDTIGQIGSFQLVSETGIAAGVRRIEAVTGAAVDRLVNRQRRILSQLEGLLGVQESELDDRISQILVSHKELERELQGLRREATGSSMDDLVDQAQQINGIRVVASEVQPADMNTFREMGDGLRNALGSGVGVLGAAMNGKASIITVVTDDLVRQGVKAGSIVKEVARVVGGGGGGKPHMAQAGGKNPEHLGEALSQVPDVVRAQLGG
ncbi:MAG: alanine--tRNA ligase [Gemmatimonadetes bacterium]|nr:alanine--tRNA ligase [Gemmatimonadota bacterium]